MVNDEGVYFWGAMELLSKLPCTFRCEPTPPSDCSARNVGDEEKQASPSESAQECPVDDGDECSLDTPQEHCTICPAVFYHLAGTVNRPPPFTIVTHFRDVLLRLIATCFSLRRVVASHAAPQLRETVEVLTVMLSFS